ncbi:MAG: glycoside hydrolase family 15 protein [Candidatus Acidiferrales bacterium]
MSSRIEDYALIGDCETAALVGRDGSIDWLCWPRFDSGACFAAVLGTPEHGRWKIAPAGPVEQTRREYRKSALILETDFETDQGAVTLIDFMPLRENQSDVVRLVRGRRGQVQMQMELSLRFDYGQSVPWVTRMDDGSLRAIAGPNMAVLRTSAPIRGEDLKTVSEFTVHEGETVPFVLTYGASHLSLPEPIDPQAALQKTEAFWREWTGRCTYRGPWAEVVERSLITLKALTYWPTGGILAAPTTSLPEKPGGKRNWDYRFCWLRDATFTLLVLMNAGYLDEASDWQTWLLRAVAGSPEQVQTLYGLSGERQFPERELGWLPGYEGSRPVRVGNAASEQLQLDIYGEIAGVLHHAREAQLPRSGPGIELEWKLLEHLEKIWREPDEGIWEVRGPKRQFTHSKVMAWVAFDRAVRSCEQFGLKGPVDRWRVVRQEIHDDVCRHGFDPDLGSFVQFYGSKELDASLLAIAKIGFLPPSDPRIAGTVRAIERHLMRDGFLLRYLTDQIDDGLPPGEGAFLACSFWLADNYLLLGRHSDARQLFERLLRLQNDVGLLSEEYDLDERHLVGNFPQALSHVALVSTAFGLARMSGPASTVGRQPQDWS